MEIENANLFCKEHGTLLLSKLSPRIYKGKRVTLYNVYTYRCGCEVFEPIQNCECPICGMMRGWVVKELRCPYCYVEPVIETSCPICPIHINPLWNGKCLTCEKEKLEKEMKA